jgi:diguanylate cyclase (GGDEF)-like protein
MQRADAPEDWQASINPELPQEPGSARARSAHGRPWLLAAWLTLALGIAGSLTGASLWRSSVRAQNRQIFDTAAADVSATLGQLLRGDVRTVEMLRAAYRMEPRMSDVRFAKWVSELDSLLPTTRTSDGRGYCLLGGGRSLAGSLGNPGRMLNHSWCDPRSTVGGSLVTAMTQSPVVTGTMDKGRLQAFSAAGDRARTAFVEAAVYRRGAPLATVAERQAATIAWVASSFDVRSLITTAISGNRGLAVAIYHSNPGRGAALFGAGGTPRGTFARTQTLQAEGPWQVRVTGAAMTSGPSAQAQALIVLLVGALLSLLLFAVFFTLARSRERALRLVAQRTGELRHQALHDALTGLPNRVLALDRAEQMLARARRANVPIAALHVDLHGFKQINDTFGNAIGDELLRIVAQRLRSVVRQGDTAARLGGDEFVVLLEGATLDAGPELVAERLLEVLRQPYDLTDKGARELTLSASVGIAEGLRDNADALLAEADVALDEAKAAGKNRWVRFEAEMQTAALRKLTIELDLGDALKRDELFLLYQPIFELHSQAVVGAEALVRWQHPDRGLLTPDQFIAIAEGNGAIVALGRWVLREACRQAREWQDAGYEIGVSVNVSVRQLEDATILSDVELALAETGVEATRLTLEITETALMRDPSVTAQQLHALKRIGVGIAIDDFGTGYSSLAYLRQFPVDKLKIDRSFIADVTRSRESDALIHTLVQLGKSLDIETLAEGIEDEAQLHALQREGCDQGQGFWFARPIEAVAVEALLGEGDAHAVRSGTYE